MRSFGCRGAGKIVLQRWIIAAMCAGVVPQQPPASQAPSRTSSSITAANSSGPTSNTVRPSTLRGSPALGFTIIGMEQQSRSWGKRVRICSGPRPQLKPMASAPSPSKRATAAAMSPPVRSLPFSSKIIVTNTGREVFSFAASSAAFASYVSLMVSIKIRSAPAFSPHCAASLKAS